MICTPNSLLEAAKCFKCIPAGAQDALTTYLMALKAGGSTDPKVLMAQAKCFRCIPPGQMGALLTYLLCQSANEVTPTQPFSYAPDTKIIHCHDSIGNHAGNLATFNATADQATVDVLTMSTLSLVSITGLGGLPSLSTFDCSQNFNLVAIDFTGCAVIAHINVGSCNLTSLNVSMCPNLLTLACAANNNLASINVSGCVLIQTIACGSGSLTALNCSGLSVLINLDCSFNQLGTVNLTGCVALQNFTAFTNPALVVIGP
jgi:hypothetical protein